MLPIRNQNQNIPNRPSTKTTAILTTTTTMSKTTMYHATTEPVINLLQPL